MKKEESIYADWKGALAVILFAVIMALLFCSCSSKSGQLMQTKYEKCIVLDTSYPTYYILKHTKEYKYRIQRIEDQGTITTIYSPKIWLNTDGTPVNTGDTIELRFSQIINEDN